MLTGYEQVRSVVCALTGDEQGAREVKLVLPETGACSSEWLEGSAAASASCCGGPTEAQPIALSLGSPYPSRDG
jgi:hypothetical protein